MKIKLLSILVLIGFVLAIAVPVFAGDTSGSVNTGVGSGVGGVVKAAPTATPPSGTYNSNQTISLSAQGSEAIYYTTDTTSSPSRTTWTAYSSPLSTVSFTTFRAAAYYADGTFGPVGSYTYNIVIQSSGGGGGGAGAPAPIVNTTGDADVSSVFIGGQFKAPVYVNSADGNAQVDIPAYTGAQTVDGSALTHITVTPISPPPAPPADASAVASTYDFGPSGLKFSTPVTITMKYDPSKIPPGTTPYIAWYNTQTGQWEQLTTLSINSSVNPPTISALVSHFTAFSVFAPAPPPLPTPTATPSPTPSPSASVTSPPSTSVTPTVSPSPTLAVTTPPATTPPATPQQPSPTINWGLIIGIILVVVVILILVMVLVVRKR